MLLAVAVTGGGVVAVPVHAQDPEDLAPLSPTPQGDGGSSSPSGIGSSSPPGGGARLPQTGSDARLLALAGLALVLAGIGGRLRTIPERF